MIMCRSAALPGSSSPLPNKLDPASDPPDTSPSRTRVEASSITGSALAHAAPPHQPAAYPEYLDKPGRPGAPTTTAFAGQKRHRVEQAHHEAGHGRPELEAPPQMLQLHPVGTMNPEAGSRSSPVPREPGGSSSSHVHVTEANPVPWAPVLLDAKVESMRIERSGSTYCSSPSLTQEPLTSLELDSGKNLAQDVSRPSPTASEGTNYFPHHWHSN